MPIVIPKREIWIRQPSYGSGVDKQGINTSLCFAWHARVPEIEQVSGKKCSTDNTSLGGASVGQVVNCSASQVNLEWSSQFCTTSNGAGTGDFTFIILANPAASGSGAVEHALAQKNDAGGTPFTQAIIGFHADQLASYLSGSATFFIYNGDVTSAYSAAACDGAWHLWAGVRSGTVHTLYRDGVALSTNTGTARTITQASPSRYVAIGSRGNGSTESYQNSAAMAAMFNRALSTQELLNLTRNPWQIFQP